MAHGLIAPIEINVSMRSEEREYFMNIQCPVCKAPYAIPEEKFSKPVIKAVCKKCSTKMIIDRDSKTVQATPETESQVPGQVTHPEPSPGTSSSPMPPPSEEAAFKPPLSQPGMSVSSMSPEYPKYRDVLIIGIMIVILVIALVGGYFLIMRTETAFKKFSQNPIKYLANIANVYETYEICKSFLHQNEELFHPLGKDLKFSLIKEEVRVINGKKTARMMIKAQGNIETGDVFFVLQKYKRKWRIVSVALKLRNGGYKTLYPRPKSSAGGI